MFYPTTASPHQFLLHQLRIPEWLTCETPNEIGYEWSRAFFEAAAVKAGRASKKLTTVESMLAGAIAGSATVIITNPIWVVNTRMTARTKASEEQVLPGSKPAKSPSTIGTFVQIVKEEGLGRLFAGVMPALVLVVNPILQYTVFEQLKNIMEQKRRVTPTDSFYMGAIGKLLATSITYPYITVKSRMHVAGKDGPKEGMGQTFSRILREDGWNGLYGGECSGDAKREGLNADYCLYRHWAKGYTERFDRGVSVRFQGRTV